MGVDACQQLLDIEEIKKLKARYFRFYDAKDWDGFVGVLSDDLEFTFVDVEIEHYPPGYSAFVTPQGDLRLDRDQLMAWLVPASRYDTLHHGHMPEVTITGADTASAIWRVTDLIQWPGEPPVWARGYGRYDEEYERTADGWRLRRSRYDRHDIDPVELAVHAAPAADRGGT
jgi:hypothetical protein